MQLSYRQFEQRVKTCPYALAAPSWVWPGSLAENCERLSGAFPQVHLLFLESPACLAYGRKELPASLAQLPLSYHLHLPLDLDWEQGAPGAFKTVAALAEKIDFLSPLAFVLHPPSIQGRERLGLVADMARLWQESGREPGRLLLENTRDAGPGELLAVCRDTGLGLCLDLGHVMAYEQALPRPAELAGRVGMLHLSAPGPNAEHLSLLNLEEEGVRLMRGLLEAAGRGAVLTLEIFEPQGLFESAAWLADKIEAWDL